MAYTKQTWVTGDIITASKLNHMEDGIESINPSLPTVTSADNGKFLRVVSGSWDAATVPDAEQESY